MPLTRPEEFGSDEGGYRVNDYCRHCYADGAFTDPDITMAQMIDKCVAIMTRQNIMPEARARELLDRVMPRMKRWRGHPAATSAGTGKGRGAWAGDDMC
jgi:hypothetical protein